ncbi:MAG: hypothetical protein ACI4F4_01400 [Lachnospiraceae bacterium]
MGKKFVAVGMMTILLIGGLAGLTACGKTDSIDVTVDSSQQETTESVTKDSESTTEQVTEDASDTVAGILVSQFKTEAESTGDVLKIADALSKNPVFKDVAMTTMEVEPGFLNGFENEIKGFSKGVMFAPMIGTIPFVGYVFETEDPDNFVKTLEENAKLDWNICTTADEMRFEIVGNYVVFVMAPKSFAS